MPFQRDERFAIEIGKVYGEYLTSFVSEPSGQVQVDIFRNGPRVEAHVAFARGVDATNTTENYVNELLEYARNEGVADRFGFIFS